MASPTRQNLINASMRRFYTDGFRNVGLDQILADVGISKTAFYKHFESKDDLMLAVLEEHHVEMEQMFRDVIAKSASDSPRRQLESLFDAVEGIVDSNEFQGCIFINASIEFPLPHEPVHRAAAASKQAIEDVVSDLAARAGAANPLALSQELCMIMEGAYVTRHVTSNPNTAHIARRVAQAVLDAHLGPKEVGATI